MVKLIEDLFEVNELGTARFVLGEKNSSNLVIVGVNPSIATLDKLDPTSKRVRNYSNLQENRGWILINLYPHISTKIKSIHKQGNNELILKNNEFIESILKCDNITLVAAWGESIETRNYLKDCLYEINNITKKNNLDWYCFEQTKYGHPCHPLFRRKGFRFYETKLNKFNFNHYFQNL